MHQIYDKYFCESLRFSSMVYMSRSFPQVNRRRNRRFLNGKGVSKVLGASYVDEIGDYSFREQLDLFSRYSVVLMSHGAGETNFLASSSWQEQHTIPVSAIIVCPPYLHCGCITTGIAIDGGGTCARHYNPITRQDVLFSTIVFEYSNKNCTAFCSEVESSKISVKNGEAGRETLVIIHCCHWRLYYALFAIECIPACVSTVRGIQARTAWSIDSRIRLSRCI
eukprot:m.545282 g.545282  ORF g.545282 m.545282 type:complete len:223 (+) comp22144_c1_seq1:1177-1845(+)